MSYDKPVVTYDEYETAVSIHCVRCGCVVKRRAEIPSRADPRVMLHTLMRAPNYREVPLKVSDGSSVYVILCAECVSATLDEEKAIAQVKAGWEAELRHAGRSEEVINEAKARMKTLTSLTAREEK